MKIKTSDIMDRWTILRMKVGVDKSIESEYLAYTRVARRILAANPYPMTDHVLTLQEVNAKIWMLEASIRKEYIEDADSKETLTLSEVGRRALRIRELNMHRMSAKTAIDKMMGDPPDKKV